MRGIFVLSLLLSMHLKAEVSIDQMREMIDQMIEKNVISKEEGEKAKYRVIAKKTFSPEGRISNRASSGRFPASLTESRENTIVDVQGIDINSAQLNQIHNDIGNIFPQAKD